MRGSGQKIDLHARVAWKGDEGGDCARARLRDRQENGNGHKTIEWARSIHRRTQLWTNDILHAARAIYIAEGFELIAQEKHDAFGQDLVGRNWELLL